MPLLGQRLVRGETMAVDINKARVRLGAIWAELGYDQGVIRSPDGFQTVRLGLLCWNDTTQKRGNIRRFSLKPSLVEYR